MKPRPQLNLLPPSQADNLPILDLLWKHYEKARNYGSAARILDKLADREG